VGRLAQVPVWVFHGAKDHLVPLERAKEMVDALRKAGGTVKFTIYPDRDHDAWPPAYNDPELYKWLLDQKRTHREQGNLNK
jgi:dipeptidyl aminopeptidase/acylaminoacyl peptidase